MRTATTDSPVIEVEKWEEEEEDNDVAVERCASPEFALPLLSGSFICAASASTEDCSSGTYALKFCHMFPEQSCCLPAQDAEIEEHYFNLLDAGDICAKQSSMAKDALKLVFCAACSEARAPKKRGRK